MVPFDPDTRPTARALRRGDVDVAVLFTGSSVIPADAVLLRDDKGLQPAENPVLLMRDLGGDARDVAGRRCGVGRITTSVYNRMSLAVSRDERDPTEVAARFLAEQRCRDRAAQRGGDDGREPIGAGGGEVHAVGADHRIGHAAGTRDRVEVEEAQSAARARPSTRPRPRATRAGSRRSLACGFAVRAACSRRKHVGFTATTGAPVEPQDAEQLATSAV